MSKRRKRRSSADREVPHLVQFAAEVRAARAVQGWSQTELARRTAVTQRAIYCIEQNVVRPRKQTELYIGVEFLYRHWPAISQLTASWQEHPMTAVPPIPPVSSRI
jgi:transcriptional regulator with XRE-family HTH domain